MLDRVRALLGGTFDPPHLGHLAAGEAAYRSLGLKSVAFLPAGDPWQKRDRSVTGAEHRLAMTRTAIADVSYFTVDERELHRDGPSYTIDTLEALGDERVVLVLGADAAAGLRSWHRADEVAERAAIAVVPRAGIARSAVAEAVPDAVWLDMPELPISGADLRARVAAGASIRFLVRAAVWEYIEMHGLYREAS